MASHRALLIAAVLALGHSEVAVHALGTQDCNGNGVPDTMDIAAGTSTDCDENGVPDACDLDYQVQVSGHFLSGILSPDARTADLDGNGVPDIVAGSGSDLYWMKGVGSNAFLPPRLIAQLGVVQSIDIADLDGDEDLDLVVGSYLLAENLLWFENGDGRGTFGPGEEISGGVGVVNSVNAVDLDGDGPVDLVVTRGPRVAWHRNLDGAGTFGSTRQIGLFNEASQAVPVDLDGDSDLDIVAIGVSSGGRVVWFENLDGTGGAWTEHLVADGLEVEAFYYLEVATGDLDGDGDPDLASVTPSGVAWYENLGIGDFGPPGANLNPLSDSAFTALAIADVDSDGDNDILADDQILWFENLGAGAGFAPPVVLGGGAMSLVVSDLNVDGVEDLLVATFNNGVYWLTGSTNDCNGNGLPDDCDLAAGSPDCTANGVPDECEPDCNQNEVADSCDLDSGVSLDCDLDGIPDECGADCDASGVTDACELPPGSTCDPGECDADQDYCYDDLDCDPDDGEVSSEPVAVDSLHLRHEAGVTTLEWDPSTHPGGTQIVYDVLRAAGPAGFGSATCAATDQASRSHEDSTVPAAGQAFYFLVRVENGCPGASGSVSPASDGSERSVVDCP